MAVTKTILKPGDAGVADTIQIMNGYVRKYARDRRVQAIVKQAEQRAAMERSSERREIAKLKYLYNYVVNKMTYKPDPQWAELVKSVKHTLFGSQPYGDCDDLSIAAATLFAGAGHKVAFKTVAWRPSDPDKRFSHVYLMVQAFGGWLPMDPTMGEKGFGNEIRQVTRRRNWKV